MNDTNTMKHKLVTHAAKFATMTEAEAADRAKAAKVRAASTTRPLTNHAAVRRFALEQARITRRPFTRVSSRFVEDVEAALRTLIAGRVHSARSGKTL